MKEVYHAGSFDVAVIGGGHAGVEASLAAARMGLRTILFSISLDSIAMMPCNPSIGGTSKGHLVRELDALGGEMGKNIDKTFIQSRMLNTSKGPAVHSLRAQADKFKYQKEMKTTLEKQENLLVRQGEVVEVLHEDGKVTGVLTKTGARYDAKAIIICTGTYLRGKIIIGDLQYSGGPNGLFPATELTQSLLECGLKLRRFKTGTPARVDRKTIDFSVMDEQPGDEKIVPFSFTNEDKDLNKKQTSCYLTYTNTGTHQVIQNNLHRSPLFSGEIEGTGPRYCPSIEDKIVRFADKAAHQIFLEPEGEDTDEIYVQGMSSSLPEDVQIQMYRSIKGLEKVEIMRTAYAIEYDCVDPTLLKPSLELKVLEGLFSAGQFNGSSGYEEAAAQGLMAGINAALKVQGREPLVLDRSEAYIGVLIDDLVTKGTKEPYRMMTSRAEYRLLLRQDNADLRLTEKGYTVGLIDEERYQKFLQKKEMIQREVERATNKIIGGTKEVQALLESKGSTTLKSGVTLAELIKRPELTYEDLAPIDPDRPELPWYVREQVETTIKYDGYINRQMQQVEQFKKLENKRIPEGLDYDQIDGLRIEAKQKLMDIRPLNVGQASRISGVNPADISVLLIYIEKFNKQRAQQAKEE